MINHNRLAFAIASILGRFFKSKECQSFSDEYDVHLSPKDRVVSDAMIICDKNIVKPDVIYGPLDLVVEVPSPIIEKRDIGYKKDLYGRHGVKEYWFVSPTNRYIKQRTLQERWFEI